MALPAHIEPYPLKNVSVVPTVIAEREARVPTCPASMHLRIHVLSILVDGLAIAVMPDGHIFDSYDSCRQARHETVRAFLVLAALTQ
jgi:hypothetical protein